MWILGSGPVNYLKEGQKRGRPKMSLLYDLLPKWKSLIRKKRLVSAIKYILSVVAMLVQLR